MVLGSTVSTRIAGIAAKQLGDETVNPMLNALIGVSHDEERKT